MRAPLIFLLWVSAITVATAAVQVRVSGPAGQVTQNLPDAGGSFDVNLPLSRNAQNQITVTARDVHDNVLTKTINLTQLSLDQIVVAEVKTERLSPQRIEELVNEGVIDVEDPENFNVSTFNVVLTIGGQRVPISTPIVTPKSEPTGYEIIKLPRDSGPSSGGRTPKIKDTEVVVFEVTPPSPPGIPSPRIYGVIVMEGRIKTLKEFFSVRLLLMNTSGIFTLKDVQAQLFFPDGGLSHTLPSDGIISFGDILPGDGGAPGQKEREFIIRGDEIGVRGVKIDFGGTVAGPGLPEENPIAFNGTAESSVEVKGPPQFLVTVIHPPVVHTNEPYSLVVEIQNMGELPALYTSFDLEVGADALIETCLPDTTGTNIVCEFDVGPVTRILGHIYPGEVVRERYTLLPLKAGPITSCLGVSDQNIQLQVAVGNIGCLTGHYPPLQGEADDQPTVTVLPENNQQGVSPTASVTAFFDRVMDETSITTGSNGTFNVIGDDDDLLDGQLRFIELGGRTVAIWQAGGGASDLPENARLAIVLTGDIRDQEGHALFNPWQSEFRTTSLLNDQDPPELTLTVLPPVVPNFVLPGQLVVVNAYAADQGSGIARVELRIRNLDGTNNTYRLVDQKTVFSPFETLEPSKFTIDTAELTPGNAYQLLGTAYDVAGNARDATINLILSSTADAPTIQLPPDPTNFVLRGISVPITPRAITGAVRQVHYYLNDDTNALSTVFLAPWQSQVRTLDLGLGVHTVTAVAVDSLLQSGTDEFVFELVENLNEPIVGFGSAINGASYVTGAVFSVNGEVEDPVGVKSVQFFFNDVSGPPIASGTAPFTVDTSFLPTGTYSIIILASNNLGIANNPLDPAARLNFNLVEAPPNPPPPAPAVTSISLPDDGRTTVAGTSVPGAIVTIVNTNKGFIQNVTVAANSTFSGTLDADGGDGLRLTALHAPTSPSNSLPTSVIVPMPRVVTNLMVSPSAHSFTAIGQFIDLVVTAEYGTGETSNVTARATYSSSKPSVASVNSAGRVVAQGPGSANVTASFGGKQALSAIVGQIVVMTNLFVDPDNVLMVFTGQTQQLTVYGQFNNGTSNLLNSGVSFAYSGSSVIHVNHSGLVTGLQDGNAQVYVSAGNLPPVTVPVSIISGLNPVPVVNITSPANHTGFQPGTPVNVIVNATDPVGPVTRLELEVTGAVTFSDFRQISPAQEDVTRTFSFIVPPDAPVGDPITVQARARDVGGLTSTVKQITLHVVDHTPPVVNLLSPLPGDAFNSGHTVTVTVAASDTVGVTEVGYTTAGALNQSDSVALSPSTLSSNVTFQFIVPPSPPESDLFIFGTARDAAGNATTSSPVQVELTGADITPPDTEITAIAYSGGATAALDYTVLDGMDDLDHVAIYWRRNGIGTFNRYIHTDTTNLIGRFFPQSGANGTVIFDSTKMGGDGHYEFYSVGKDENGNLEPAPVAGFDRSTNINAGTVWTVITNSIFIGAGDPSFDNQNVRISNAVVTLEGVHTFHNVDVLGTGMITHAATTLTNEPAFNVSIWSLHVASNASVAVDARGYLGGLRDGNGHAGRTTNNVLGATVRSGGSHGGLGGISSGTPNPLYGNLVQPTALGSGGSSNGSGTPGGNGGGRIQLNAIHIAADGPLSADGQVSGNTAASGSGGSIFIITHTLSGQGFVRANGGAFQIGGGGGRVAIHYTDMRTKDPALIQALGGQGSSVNGGNGTVFLKSFDEGDGTLVIDGQDASGPFSGLPIPQGMTFDNIIIRNNARVIVDDPILANDSVQILSGSILTHSVGQTNGLSITAQSVWVDETSAIDVSEKGYRGGIHDGNPFHTGETLHGQVGAVHRAGGSYGGLGGRNAGIGNNLVYGIPQEPVHLGAGGSSNNSGSPGGNGGGRITIHATDSVTVHGAIRADGQASANTAASGAGGSVLIHTSLFQGSGHVSANGGAYQVGGGGGRVAVYYNFLGVGANDFADLRSVTAHGGKGSSVSGSAGTVFLKQASQAYGNLYLDEGLTNATSTLWTPLSPIGFGHSVNVSSNVLALDGGVALLPGGLVGATVQPNLNDPALFTVLDNTATTLVVDVSSGTNLTDVASAGDRYAALHRFDNVYFRRGAFMALGDRLQVDGNLAIAEDGVLTHLDATLNFEPGLDLIVGALSVSADSAIDVDGRGYLGGLNGGNGHAGRTLDNALGSIYRSGGSYGGLGGGAAGAANPTYGDLTEPDDLGSGGSSNNSSSPGGDGGGRIKISANQLVIDGLITANGAISENTASSGSGGAILIQAQQVSGSGTVQANGGAYQVGGGGGRVAVHYTTLSMAQNQFQALGGQGSSADGGNGTLYFKGHTQTHGDFVIDGGGFVSPIDSAEIPAGFVFDNLILRDGAQVVADAPITVTDSLQLLNGSALRHPQGLEAGLAINAATVFVDATSLIDGSGRGYRGGIRDGNPLHSGETLYGQVGAVFRAGGSYGGLGGRNAGIGNNLVYGIPQEPVHLGAGGSSNNSGSPGGNGGGRITIHASESVTVHGAIRADGQVSANTAASGAGGSVLIHTSLFQGSGHVSANGGAYQVGGGGGRVAVHYNLIGGGTNGFDDLRSVTAYGGKGSTVHGSAGTVFFKQTTQSYGDLYLDEGLTNSTSALWSPLTPIGFGLAVNVSSNVLEADGGVAYLPGGLVGMTLQPNEDDPALFTVVANTATTLVVDVSSGTNLTDIASAGDRYAALHRFDNVYFRRGAFMALGDRLQVDGNLAIAEHGVLTHLDATLNFEPGLDLIVGALSVSADSAIDVDGRGYLGGLNGGNGHAGRTLDNALGSTYRSGGSYGGKGGRTAGAPNPTYGDLAQPGDLGSGGSSNNSGSPGGDGGGRIKISANQLVIDGLITANGATSWNTAASGSGGAIWIQAQDLSGSGTLHAHGGAYQVGGGGGRIAVHYTTLSINPNQFQALGGQGSTDVGGNGTVFFKSAAQGLGDLVIDGQGATTPSDSTPLPDGMMYDNLYLINSARVVAASTIIVSNALEITGGSVLTHPLSLQTGLVIRAASLHIDAGSAIDVTARGYRGGLSAGNGVHQGLTTNDTPGSNVRSGGSYGGLGGQDSGVPNPVYGDHTNPVELGSGGSSNGSGTPGSNGGGRVDIWVSGLFNHNGVVRADGGEGTSASGAGSGGAILIRADTLKGSGVIVSDGGAARAAGGGGRIAIYYDTLLLDTNLVTAAGGVGSVANGSPGSVYFEAVVGGPGPFALSARNPRRPIPLISSCQVCDQGRLHLHWTDGDVPDGWLIEFSPTLSDPNWIIYDGPITNNGWSAPMGNDAPPAGFFRLRQAP